MINTYPALRGLLFRLSPETAHTIGLPPTGCTTLGRSDFILVPLPAARMTAEIDLGFALGMTFTIGDTLTRLRRCCLALSH